MKKVISYRQKIISLARIYKIAKVLDENQKLTTYEIELELLRNKVPIPSRRGYFSHKVINEFFKPIYNSVKEKFEINININKNIKIFYNSVKDKVSINISIGKSLRKIFEGVNNSFVFVISSITNFFKTITKIIVESLNNIYNFKVNEKIINKFILRGALASFLFMFIFGGFYIKGYITNLDSVKISLEIKSDKTNKEKDKYSKNLKNKKEESKEIVKKPKEKKAPYDPENDYNLNTLTVLNLFEDLDYDLDNVRDSKLVKPIYFTRLPKDLDSIRSTKKKKETFLKILLPLIVAENEKIEKNRKYLLKILKQNDKPENKKWINKKYRKYKVSNRDINELIEKMDVIPISIALAQAAKESGWGTSRFALEGNAIFGQWTYKGDGIEPLEKTDDQNHKILKFPLLRASVKAYITNLNTHNGYKGFRKKRIELRQQNKPLLGQELVDELDNYAQTGKEYTKVLRQIIDQNDLDEFETIEIDDQKNKKELKL
ncbi:MAG: glucosaminidase domain-containing protein [Pelagibacteraceae bacterium]|nr:glucosaminidase domain-containing protein [Pelagibacteraceae bacterium]